MTLCPIFIIRGWQDCTSGEILLEILNHCFVESDHVAWILASHWQRGSDSLLDANILTVYTKYFPTIQNIFSSKYFYPGGDTLLASDWSAGLTLGSDWLRGWALRETWKFQLWTLASCNCLVQQFPNNLQFFSSIVSFLRADQFIRNCFVLIRLRHAAAGVVLLCESDLCSLAPFPSLS